jgi:1-hydroxycarotenoid 3,4-desaturase
MSARWWRGSAPRGSARSGARPRSRPWRRRWRSLEDDRLRQLFGRYATYCGSSPYAAPATLMLVAHVEMAGVWLVEGGMHRLARAVERLATERGAAFRYGAHVEEILIEHGRAAGVRLAGGETLRADAVICNGDVGALASGMLGAKARKAVPPVPREARSISAMVWSAKAQTSGFPLIRHTVFFDRGDYASEFDAIFRERRTPDRPTVYICAQDRADDPAGDIGPERLHIHVNAPADGDRGFPDAEEIERCRARTFALLEQCGLTVALTPEATVLTTPREFEALFPGTGGALFGRTTHGPLGAFTRPAAKTKVPGLYVAGGSAHPGAGVPMAAMSGRLAAAQALSDLASTSPARRAAISGGIATRSRTTASAR